MVGRGQPWVSCDQVRLRRHHRRSFVKRESLGRRPPQKTSGGTRGVRANIRKPLLHHEVEKWEGDVKHLLRVTEEPMSALQEVRLQELGEEGQLCCHSTGCHYLRPDGWYFFVDHNATYVSEVWLYKLQQSTPRFLRGQPGLGGRAHNVGCPGHGSGDRGAYGLPDHCLKVDPEASGSFPGALSFTRYWAVVLSAPP